MIIISYKSETYERGDSTPIEVTNDILGFFDNYEDASNFVKKYHDGQCRLAEIYNGEVDDEFISIRQRKGGEASAEAYKRFRYTETDYDEIQHHKTIIETIKTRVIERISEGESPYNVLDRFYDR